MKAIAILGSTGSIGRNAVLVAEKFPDHFSVKALAAKNNVDLLLQQIKKFQPDVVSVYDAETAETLRKTMPQGLKTEVLFGSDGYRAVATHASVETVLSAMVGAAGLEPTVAAIGAGKEIALANKESLVMAGEIVMAMAAEKGVRILPVDSEHSAIFQCLAGQRRTDVFKIHLTASGGPFLDHPKEAFATIKPSDALRHPTWEMGPKITIDSATLMNKGLEVIEASHLFDIPISDIDVLIHPQSLVHSMVSFRDGAVIAQMGAPDMKGAIAYALSYPKRLPLGTPPPDFAEIGSLVFKKPDFNKFKCLSLAFKAGKAGGSLPAVLNAANEIAVSAFLSCRLAFDKIPGLIERTMAEHERIEKPSLADIIAADQWARQRAEALVNQSPAV